MTKWETDSAILGSDEELELQANGWEPFAALSLPPPRADYALIVYRRILQLSPPPVPAS